METISIGKQEKASQEALREIAGSLEYSACIQRSVLPKQRHFDRIFDDSFVLYLPQQFISGDFFWVAEYEGLKYIAVGDCTGHGIPAAMLSILAYTLFNYAVLNKGIKKTHKILREVDKRFTESFSDNNNGSLFNNDWVDISLCCIDSLQQKIWYAGGRRKIMHVSSSKSTLISGSSYPIGGWQIEECRIFESTSFTYKTGDALYLGSDGFQDQKGGLQQKRFNSGRLHKMLAEQSHLLMQEQKQFLMDLFEEWKGNNSQSDDVCIVGIRL
jgi:serine phosphatase RsbU (regulator of sigma subunit)